MGLKYANNAGSYITSALTPGSVTLTVQSGDGAKFPALTVSDYFYGTLFDNAGNIEIVKVTARTGDVMTITRAQDSTTALSWASATRFELRQVAASLNDIVTTASTAKTTADTAKTTADAAAASASSATSTANAATSTANTAKATADTAKATADAALPAAQKASANGVASLDGTGNVPATQLGNVATRPQEVYVDASVASNALTLTLKAATVALAFRSPTLSIGGYNLRSITSDQSIVIPSGATLGTVSDQPSRIALLVIDNAGTLELAVCNLSGTSLDETTLISTTALSASSNSNNVIYSNTARTSLPFRIAGIFDVTETTAGTWAAAPTVIQGAGGQSLKNVGSFQFATLATTSGTSLDVTGIPDWVNRITLVLNSVTMTGILQLQIGAGSIVSSGYRYTQKTFTASAVAVVGSLGASNWPIQTIAGDKSGTVILNRSPGTDRWTAVSDIAVGTVNETELIGFLALSGTLDRLRLSSSNTAFSAGSMSIIWE